MSIILPLVTTAAPALISPLGRFPESGHIKAEGHGSFHPWPSRFVIATGSSPARGIRCRVYVADAPGGAGSASRIRLSSGTRDVCSSTVRSIRTRVAMVKRPSVGRSPGARASFRARAPRPR